MTTLYDLSQNAYISLGTCIENACMLGNNIDIDLAIKFSFIYENGRYFIMSDDGIMKTEGNDSEDKKGYNIIKKCVN